RLRRPELRQQHRDTDEGRDGSRPAQFLRENPMTSIQRALIAVAGVTLVGAGLAAQQTIQINGAGATFPNPIYSKWFDEYNKVHPNVEINYSSLGSGAGIQQVTAQTVFFGATDGPMTPEQLQAAPGKILHFPTVLGAVVPVYTIPNLRAELKF